MTTTASPNAGTPYATIPYAKLAPGRRVNARKTGREEGIDELAALIRAKGLIEPLVVRPSKTGEKFEVTAGNRRYAAIGLLLKRGDWPKQQEVPCIVREETDEEARETSLVENIGRLPMHAVDQFEQFALLSAGGMSDAEIAARYGVPERTIRQRLALGNLAPEIRNAWREEEIDAETAQAFTISDSAEVQLRVFERLKEGGRIAEYHVRRELAGDRIRTDDERFQLVGRDAYEKAGGKISEDLFNEHSFIEDPTLLDGLVVAHLDAVCKRLTSDGWAWASTEKGLSKNWRGWERLARPEPDLTTEERARLEAIDTRLREISDSDQFSHDDDAEQERIEMERDEINLRGRERAYSTQQKKRSGCVVGLGWNNNVEITLGVVRPSDAKDDPEAADADNAASGAASSPKSENKGPYDISAALFEDVTRQQTEAAALALTDQPELALRFLLASLESYTGKPVDISIGVVAHGRASIGHNEFPTQLKKVAKYDRARLDAELVRLVAASMNMVVFTASGSNIGAPLVAMLPGDAYLAAARKVFNATDYFSRSGRLTAEAALKEMVKAELLTKGDLGAVAGGKKSAAATLAAEHAKRFGWLPPEMRHPDYAIGTMKPKGKRGSTKEAA
jgi:ParB family transcriptional regulator, chromosome partitioning protein